MKRVFCLLCVLLAVCFAACSLVDSNKPDGHWHCLCNGSRDHTCQKHQYVAVSTAQEMMDAMAGGEGKANIYLTADITFEETITIQQEAEVEICLCGKTLSMTCVNMGKLNVTDCAGEGTWTSANDFTIKGLSDSQTDIYAGKITIGGASPKTQVIILDGSANEEFELAVDNATVNIYGGEITNPNQTGLPGANIWVGKYGVLNLYNGKIGYANAVVENNKDYNRGGSIALYGGGNKMTMYGGEIAGGSIVTTDGSANGYGGNIGVYRGALYIYGGVIRDGYSSGNGGNISTSNTTDAIVVENATITGGKCGKFGGNLHIGSSGEQAVVKNSVFRDGEAVGAGGNIYLAGVPSALENITVTGGKCKNEPAGGLAIDGLGGKTMILSGENVFDNNFGSDICLRKRSGVAAKLSVTDLGGSDDIFVAGSMWKNAALQVTIGTNPILQPAEGFMLTQADGALVLSNAK